MTEPMTVTTLDPFGARPGDVVLVGGETWVVKSSIACEMTVRAPRWYDRIRWQLRRIKRWWAYQVELIADAYLP